MDGAYRQPRGQQPASDGDDRGDVALDASMSI
jgi:hypothetical protein